MLKSKSSQIVVAHHLQTRRDSLMTQQNGADPLISLSQITKLYKMGDQVVRALAGVDLSIMPNEYVAIMGPSGSGKSTMMNIIGCLDTPTAGTYLLNGRDVSALNDNQLAEIRNQEIGFVFQTFNLLPRVTCLQNVELPLIYSGKRKGIRREMATQALNDVGLGDRITHKPNELSGGQRQRVAVARALVNRPSLVLADEPTGNLDTKTGDEIMVLFERLYREGNTLLVVTHEEEIANYARRVIRLRDGLIESDRRIENPTLASSSLEF